jgi:hypothetical protein
MVHRYAICVSTTYLFPLDKSNVVFLLIEAAVILDPPAKRVSAAAADSVARMLAWPF